MQETLQWGDGKRQGGALPVAGIRVPSPHVGCHHSGEGACGAGLQGSRLSALQFSGAAFDELGGAQGMIKGGKHFIVPLFAAIVQDRRCHQQGVVRVRRADVRHVAEVRDQPHYGFGVAYQPALAQGDGGLVLAGGGGGHAPKTTWAFVQHQFRQLADACMLYQAQFVL